MLAGLYCFLNNLNLFSDILLYISPKKKLQVYSQTIQAILLHGSESQVYSTAQTTRIDSLHFKALRQVLQVKSSYYHRVLNPSDSECSNQYLLDQSFQVLRSLKPTSIRISHSRTKYLGHIFRHPTSLEYQITFSPFRRGAPLALAEAQRKAQLTAVILQGPNKLSTPLFSSLHSGSQATMWHKHASMVFHSRSAQTFSAYCC